MSFKLIKILTEQSTGLTGISVWTVKHFAADITLFHRQGTDLIISYPDKTTFSESEAEMPYRNQLQPPPEGRYSEGREISPIWKCAELNMHYI